MIDGNNSLSFFKNDCFLSVVPLELVYLSFLLAKMHGLKYVTTDTDNVYLTTYTNKKLYIVAGKNFGPDYEGKHLILENSIYATRTGGTRFH